MKLKNKIYTTVMIILVTTLLASILLANIASSLTAGDLEEKPSFAVPDIMWSIVGGTGDIIATALAFVGTAVLASFTTPDIMGSTPVSDPHGIIAKLAYVGVALANATMNDILDMIGTMTNIAYITIALVAVVAFASLLPLTSLLLDMGGSMADSLLASLVLDLLAAMAAVLVFLASFVLDYFDTPEILPTDIADIAIVGVATLASILADWLDRDYSAMTEVMDLMTAIAEKALDEGEKAIVGMVSLASYFDTPEVWITVFDDTAYIAVVGVQTFVLGLVITGLLTVLGLATMWGHIADHLSAYSFVSSAAILTAVIAAVTTEEGKIPPLGEKQAFVVTNAFTQRLFMVANASSKMPPVVTQQVTPPVETKQEPSSSATLPVESTPETALQRDFSAGMPPVVTLQTIIIIIIPVEYPQMPATLSVLQLTAPVTPLLLNAPEAGLGHLLLQAPAARLLLTAPEAAQGPEAGLGQLLLPAPAARLLLTAPEAAQGPIQSTHPGALFNKYGISFREVTRPNKPEDRYIVQECKDFSGYSEEEFRALLENMECWIRDFNSLGDRGYVNQNTDFPIVSDFVEVFNLPKSKTKSKRQKSVPVSVSTLYWTYQMLLMSLYLTASRAHKAMEEAIGSCKSIEEVFIPVDESFDDLLFDMKSFRQRCSAALDPVVKMVIQNRGVSAVKNIYVGYDTEYVSDDYEKHLNKAVSYQLSLNHRVFVRVPQPMEFLIGEKDAKTGVFRVKQDTNPFELDLQRSIDSLCKDYRAEFFAPVDEFNQVLTQALTEQGFPSYQKNNQAVFAMERSPNKDFLEYTPEGMISSEALLDKCVELDQELGPSLVWLRDFVTGLGCTWNGKTLDFEKRLARFTVRYKGGRISLTKTRTIYLCCHLSRADLSLFSDFDTFKQKLDIVNKEFLTLTPVKYDGFNLHVRDTMLLAPAASKSLAEIGKMYGPGFGKVNIDKKWYENMEKFAAEDRLLFSLYAIRDAQITLKHVNELEDFCFGNVKMTGVPLTLSSISKAYVLNKWRDDNYSYNFTGKYMIGNPAQIFTPKGLYAAQPVGTNIGLFIANYKGGRNESFMYGVDSSDRKWYDYDLSSAYTTAMAYLGDPDYWKIKVLNRTSFSELINEEDGFKKLLSSYTVVECYFSFPTETVYPSIPVYVDETTTVYPLKGKAYLTGFEIVTALQQGCDIKFIAGVCIPFKTIDGVSKQEIAAWGSIPALRSSFAQQPFFNIMKEVQKRRKAFAKGTIGNNMWKNIGNSIYGKVVSGMAEKRRFDVKTRGMVRLEASELTNPVMAAYTTAIVRSLIGECLHNIQKLGGKVVSVTTDGFITDIEDLEAKILAGNERDKTLLEIFRKLRYDLSDGNAEALELKNTVSGLISWSTRGQYSFDGRLKAMTGYQRQGVDVANIVDMLTKTVKYPGDKSLSYVQSSLRSSRDIFEKGGHVTNVYKDQIFRPRFDNRRLIVNPNTDKNSVIETLLDSKPLRSAKDCEHLRGLGNILTKKYDMQTHATSGSKYKSKVDLAIRNFIRLFLAETPGYGLDRDTLKRYNDIIAFVKEFDPKARISKQSISNLKHRKLAIQLVPNVKETRDFVEYVQKLFPEFPVQKFLKPPG